MDMGKITQVLGAVIDVVDHSVVADADPQVRALPTLQRLGAGRPWVIGKGSYLSIDSCPHRGRQRRHLPRRGFHDLDAVGHLAGSLLRACA